MQECKTYKSLHRDVRECDLVVTSSIVNNVLERATFGEERRVMRGERVWNDK
jgi:hypothetical protein